MEEEENVSALRVCALPQMPAVKKAFPRSAVISQHGMGDLPADD